MGFRENFNNMILRSRGGIGQWVVVRHFDRTRKSKYWNEETKEAVGGPPYEYTDTITVASKQTAFQTSRPSTSAGATVLEFSEAVLETYRYFLQSDVTIEEDDEILDLDHSGQTTPTVDYTRSGTGAKIKQRFKVKFVHEYVQGGRGDIGYKIAIADRSYTP